MKILEVKYLIAQKKVRFADLDRMYNLRYNGARYALGSPYKKGERALSNFLSIPLNVLFPDRYDKDNNKLKPIPLSVYKYKKEYDNA